MFCVGVVVGGYFYTVGGYEEFRVPDGFPFGDKAEGVTSVHSASTLTLSSHRFWCQY